MSNIVQKNFQVRAFNPAAFDKIWIFQEIVPKFTYSEEIVISKELLESFRLTAAYL